MRGKKGKEREEEEEENKEERKEEEEEEEQLGWEAERESGKERGRTSSHVDWLLPGPGPAVSTSQREDENVMMIPAPPRCDALRTPATRNLAFRECGVRGMGSRAWARSWDAWESAARSR